MDSFADSFLKGWAINQQDEAMKRQKDAAQLQQLVQVMQFQKMAADLQRQAGLEQALASPEVQKQLGPNSRAITALVRAGNHDALTKVLFPTEPRTLENILAEKVRTGEMTLQDAMKMKQTENRSLQDKTQKFLKDGKIWAQDYDYDTKTGTRTAVGQPYEYRDPASNIFVGTVGGKPAIMPSKGTPTISTTDTPGNQPIEPKTDARMTNDQIKGLVGFRDLQNIAGELMGAGRKFGGPITGRVRKITSQFIDDPEFVAIRNRAGQLRPIIYALSGKQINPSEQEWLEKEILPNLTQPGANFDATLKTFINWVQRKRISEATALKASGYIVPEDLLSDKGNYQKPEQNNNADSFLRKKGLIK
jgi:hypothetical protein